MRQNVAGEAGDEQGIERKPEKNDHDGNNQGLDAAGHDFDKFRGR
jgi:hypothetical protein